MEFPMVVVALLVEGEETDKILKGVLYSPPQLPGHQATHTVEEVLCQYGCLIRIGGNESRPTLLVHSE